MQLLEKFSKVVTTLQSTTSRNAKEAILKTLESEDDIKELFRFIYNPYIITGIGKKKINRLQHINAALNPYSIEDLLDYITIMNTGSDQVLAEVKAVLEHNIEYKDLIIDIITKDLKVGIQPKTFNKVFGKDFIPEFNCMLSEKYYDNPAKYLPEGTKFLITEKLDGSRCIMIKEGNSITFFSRQGNEFHGLHELEQELQQLPIDIVLDGELLVNNTDNLESKDLYRATVKVVNSDSDNNTDIIFNCFDMLEKEEFIQGFSKTPCFTRKARLAELLASLNAPHVKNVEILAHSTDQSLIPHYLEMITSKGGEGIMINISDAPYEAKRSKNLLKVKKFQSADVLVYAIEEGTGQNKRRVGALKIIFIGPDNNEYRCDVGSGLSEEERILFWEKPELVVNKIVEISYFEISQNQQGTYSLRFPVFKWVRNDKNEISMY